MEDEVKSLPHGGLFHWHKNNNMLKWNMEER